MTIIIDTTIMTLITVHTLPDEVPPLCMYKHMILGNQGYLWMCWIRGTYGGNPYSLWRG